MANSYNKKLYLFRNHSVQKEIRSLDPEKDHCRIVHLLTGYEFPWDMIRALEIALMRTFCSPSISALLQRTGEFNKHGQKRYDDTALLVAEFMQNGYDHERGSRAIAQMNRIHGNYKIANEDYLFVLSTFIFEPIRWIDSFGWRKTTVNEQLALYYFFKEIGVRMNLTNIPGSLEELRKFVNEYENAHFRYQPSNKSLGNATIAIVKGWLPFFAKPAVLPVMSCLLDEAMLNALGYKKGSVLLRPFVVGAMKLRAVFLKPVTFMHYPSFVTTEKNRTYRNGYTLEKLGPDKLILKR